MRLYVFFVFNLATIWVLFALFGPFRATFGVGVRFKNLLRVETYLFRQSTFFLKVQSCIFVFNSATFSASFVIFWALWGFFWPFGLFLDAWSDSNTFLAPTNIDCQFLFWNCIPIFLFSIWPNLGSFLYFLGPSGLSLGLESDSKNILGPTYVNNQLWFWKYSPIFLLYSDTFGASFALFWILRGYFMALLCFFGVGVREGYKLALRG